MPALKMKVYYGEDEHGFYWPSSKQKRDEVMQVKRGSPDSFEAIYQCRPGAREGTIFLESDLSAYYEPPRDLAKGRASPAVRAFLEKGYGVFQAWDTAYGETKQSAWSVCTTALFVPCNKYHRGEDEHVFGLCDHHFDVVILDVYRKKIGFAELPMEMAAQEIKWGPEKIIIEDRASGISAIQVMSKAGKPIVAVPAAEGKRARAINGIGAGSAQGWFRRHRVLLPRPSEQQPIPWLVPWRTEMKDFSGAEDAISDQVDSVVHLVRYAILHGVESAMFPSDWTPERGTHSAGFTIAEAAEVAAMGQTRAGDAMFLTIIGDLESMATDPFDGCCGRCHHLVNRFCNVQKMQKSEIDSCMLYVERGLDDDYRPDPGTSALRSQ